MTYPIIDVVRFEQIETLGTKEKFWFWGDDGRQWLFKAGRPGTGENWAEKVTCELANLIGLPCAQYEFAQWYGIEGVITSSFVPPGGKLVHGNELLGELIPNYPSTTRYKATQYTLSSVFTLLQAPNAMEGPDWDRHHAMTSSAMSAFAGYLVFDSWIGNPDRHHENWGQIVTVDGRKHLAPTFDHASGLGVRISDDERSARLNTRDSGFQVSAYVRKALSPFYSEEEVKLSTLDAVVEWNRASEGVRSWVSAVAEISSADIEYVFDRVPGTVMSTPAKVFAQELLEENRKRLESVI